MTPLLWIALVRSFGQLGLCDRAGLVRAIVLDDSVEFIARLEM
jgi:hypothetical protein